MSVVLFRGDVEYDFKCRNCGRLFSVTKDIIMEFCPCGYANEIKIVVEIEND